MNQEETNVLQLLTGATHFDNVSLEELQQLADDYPFFAAAQLLLSKKMQQANHPHLQQQLHKTALHFPNEQWLRYLLLKTENKNSLVLPDNDVKEEVNKTESLPAINEETILAEPNTATDNQQITEKQAEENFVTLPEENVPEQKQVTISSTNIQDEPEEAPLDDEELQQQSEPLPMEESNQKIANLLSEQAEAFHKPVAKTEEVPIGTEPFHTVDYFASQGIKLESKKEDNSFDKKVHKFTDWLRQMKRINPQPVDLGTDEEEENYVANIAASSNQTKEVITESMAEVLLKQGKNEKAIEIYQKLSLLYPHKNTYFAALLQQIKH